MAELRCRVDHRHASTVEELAACRRDVVDQVVAVLSEGFCPTCLRQLTPEDAPRERVAARCDPCGVRWRLDDARVESQILDLDQRHWHRLSPPPGARWWVSGG